MANVPTYVYPVAGVTPPTIAEAKNKNILRATITGDNSATTIVVVHNWEISAALLAAGFPNFSFENLLVAGQAANPWRLDANNLTNQITFTCIAFTGAALRVRLERPFSMDR